MDRECSRTKTTQSTLLAGSHVISGAAHSGLRGWRLSMEDAVVTACCLGWAIVSRYTKVKAAWKKLYLELKKKEEELNEPTNMTELVAEYTEAPVTGTTAEQQRLLNGGQLPH